jgi:hypothetical protein
MLCTEDFLSELDERNRVLFAPVAQAPMQEAGLLLGDDGVAVIRKNDYEEPVETRLFQAPLGYRLLRPGKSAGLGPQIARPTVTRSARTAPRRPDYSGRPHCSKENGLSPIP